MFFFMFRQLTLSSASLRTTQLIQCVSVMRDNNMYVGMQVQQLILFFKKNSEYVERFCGEIKICRIFLKTFPEGVALCRRTDRRTGIARVRVACNNCFAYAHTKLNYRSVPVQHIRPHYAHNISYIIYICNHFFLYELFLNAVVKSDMGSFPFYWRLVIIMLRQIV